MKFNTVLPALLATSFAAAQVNFEDWHAPVKGDLRGPCPLLNSLANHGILPRDGQNITVPAAVQALSHVNISAETAMIFSRGALQTSSDPGSGTFSLNDLKKHGFIEHDGSMSRKDTNQNGTSQEFDQKTFDEFIGYFGDLTDITLADAAAARWGRIQTQRKNNPNFVYSSGVRFSSYGETNLYFTMLQNAKTGKVPVNFIKTLFAEERLPYKEGWRPINAVNGLGSAQTILNLAMATPEEDNSDLVIAKL